MEIGKIMTSDQTGEADGAQQQTLANLSDPRNYQAIRKKQEELKKQTTEKPNEEKPKEVKPKITKEQQAAEEKQEKILKE